jgi:hypothetical protein
VSVRSLIDYLSQHVCAALIVAGSVAATLTISDASNATPIVITTTTPHLLTRDGVVYISGVVGNTAANDYWKITPVNATSFSLQNSVGNGAYASGGTAQSALIGGKILIGRWWVQQNQARPRIVAIPIDADGLPRDQYAMADATGNGNDDNLSDPQRAALLSPSVSTCHNGFEIQVWGGQNPPDQEYDFDATETLRDQVIRSCDALFRGNFTWGKGKWVDQAERVTTEMKLGHLFTFQLTIDAAIGQTPLVFTPPGPGFDIDVYGDNTGTPELAAEIESS